MWPELEKFLFSLLGALIGGSLVAWIGGYYSEKGKRKLLTEEWPKLMVEARETAYHEEEGKRLATKDDIDNVLEQVRLTTRETERIKAEISGGLWQRQWQIAQKRDSYVRLIETLENLKLRRSHIRRAPDAGARTEAERAEREVIEEFRRARALARLLVVPEAVDGIGRLLRQIHAIDPSTCSVDEFGASQALINDARDRVVETGKRELGLSQSPGRR